MANHIWHYNKPGLIVDEAIGPLEHEAFLRHVREGIIKPAWLVSSPTATKGQWYELSALPKLMEIRQRGIAQREADQQAEENERAREAAVAQADQQRLAAIKKEQREREADQQRQQRERENAERRREANRQPPPPPGASRTNVICGIIAGLLFLFGLSVMAGSETALQELIGVGILLGAMLWIIVAMLNSVRCAVTWVGHMIQWREQREAERSDED